MPRFALILEFAGGKGPSHAKYEYFGLVPDHTILLFLALKVIFWLVKSNDLILCPYLAIGKTWILYVW